MYPGQGDSKYRPAQVAQLNDVISYLDNLLEAADFPDYCPNGLQVPGPEDVKILATGVSAHLELFERAAEAGARS
jgi:putative NIF3 family GTP cyclohydrolase 1 type 2